MVGPPLTIPSRNLRVFRRLYGRFDLEPEPASIHPDVSKTIQPVTSADLLMARIAKVTGSVTIPSGSSTDIVILTVPIGELWHFSMVEFLRATGDNTVSEIRVQDASESSDMRLAEMSTLTSFFTRLEHPIPLQEGDSLMLSPDGAGVASSIWALAVWTRIDDVS